MPSPAKEQTADETVSETRRKSEPSASDLRTLLLVLVLTLLVAGIALFRMKDPETYWHSVERVREGVGAAYSNVASALPPAEPSFRPSALPESRLDRLPSFPGPVPESSGSLTDSENRSDAPSVFSGEAFPGAASTGSENSRAFSGTIAPEPVVIKFGTYVIELEGGIPEGETVSLSVGTAKMTVRSEKK